jgi:hypothetical protein
MQSADAALTMQQPSIRWRMVLIQSLKGFGINLVIVLGLHVIPLMAFAAPFITGFITGGRKFMTGTEGFLLGALMGLYMTFLMLLVAGGLVLAMVLRWLPAGGMDMVLFVIIPTVIILHLGIFASVGAMVGGHFARKDQVPTAVEAASAA